MTSEREIRSPTTFKCTHHVMTLTLKKKKTPSLENTWTPSTINQTKKTYVSWETLTAELASEEHCEENTWVHIVTVEQLATTTATMYQSCVQSTTISLIPSSNIEPLRFTPGINETSIPISNRFHISKIPKAEQHHRLKSYPQRIVTMLSIQKRRKSSNRKK